LNKRVSFGVSKSTWIAFACLSVYLFDVLTSESYARLKLKIVDGGKKGGRTTIATNT
jgi:hypothetical protein